MGTALEVTGLLLACAPAVAPETMLSVVTHESARNPYAININGPARLERQPRSHGEAVATARRLAELGYNFDAGLGQYNSANALKHGDTWEAVFEPCSNLRLSARVLVACYRRAPAGRDDQERLAAALSCYNSGSFRRGFANGYVANVYAVARRMVASPRR